MPEEIVSNPLIQRSIVLFPEPEGPMTTTTSPFSNSRLIFFNAWNLP
ncbi:hypothetical protein CU004_2197 [Enterococcus faecium]|nr:hypothetical protein [Enterococcus faecium]